MPKFKRGGAGTPAIMSDPTPVAPVANVSGIKGAIAVPHRDAVADAEVIEKLKGTEHRKPGRPRKATPAKPAAPEKDA